MRSFLYPVLSFLLGLPATGLTAPELVGTIPFDTARGRVTLQVSVNESSPQNLLLDSGMPFDGVYLFHKEMVDSLGMTNAADVSVGGAGSGEATANKMIEHTVLTLGDLTIPDQLAVVSLSPTTQSFPSDGVIGYSLFGHYIVELDYPAQVIRLYDPTTWATDSSCAELEMVLQGKIPFVEGTIALAEDNPVQVRMYIDLASAETLELLVCDTCLFHMPDSGREVYQGTGLSGDIHGKYGHIAWAELGGRRVSDIKVAFAPAEVRSKQDNADAVIGNGLMSYFAVAFDYTNSRLYLRPLRANQ